MRSTPMAIRALFLVVTLLVSLSARAQNLSGGKWIDLTHSFNEDSIYWPTADMSELPATGSTVSALPVKIEVGSGGPLRIIAHVN